MKSSLKSAAALTALALTLVIAPDAAAQDATIKLGGRLMIDYTLEELSDPDSTINDTEVRRARLFVSGKYGSNVAYKLELNTDSGGGIDVTDAFLQFAPTSSRFKIKVGHFKTHNSLEEEASSRFISTLERAAFTDTFDLNRRVGVSVGTSGDNYSFNIGAYAANLEDDSPNAGHAFAARATYNPILTDETVAHLGASWRYRATGDDSPDFRYRQRPYSHVSPTRIVNTGRFADSDNMFAAEAAVIHNQFWAAGEYAALNASGSGDNPDANFGGFYGEVGVFFGGKRGYKGGKWDRPKVYKPVGEGGYGALSLVARYDSLDVQDEIYLGKLDTFVVGADWWPTKQTRLGLNYFIADAENGSADKGEGFLGRLQFDF